MTKQADLKALIRARMQKTGESYTAARSHVLAARGTHEQWPDDAIATRALKELPGDAPTVDGDPDARQLPRRAGPQPEVVKLYNRSDWAPVVGLRLYEIDVQFYWNGGYVFMVPSADPECGPYSDVRVVPETAEPRYRMRGFRDLTSWETEEVIGPFEDYTEGWKHSD